MDEKYVRNSLIWGRAKELSEKHTQKHNFLVLEDCRGLGFWKSLEKPDFSALSPRIREARVQILFPIVWLSSSSQISSHTLWLLNPL